ncbi:MAG: hypothetical protein LBN39_02675, partial [Planctomycetaceae bacterium]|nr:hypothetical protein [Planctomycetaceae bacterium]
MESGYETSVEEATRNIGDVAQHLYFAWGNAERAGATKQELVAIIKVAEQVKGTSINPPYSIKKKIRNREDEFF